LIPQYFLGPGKIGRMGDFKVALIAFEDAHAKACGAGDLDIIRGTAGMGAMRGKDGGKIKGLRGLRAKKTGTILRADDLALRPDPECIGDRKGRGHARGVAGLNPRDDIGDMRRANTASRDIVDQNMRDIATARGQMLKPVAYRPGAGVAAGGDLDTITWRQKPKVIGVKHHENAINQRRGAKGVQRPVDHPPTAKRLPLLGAWHACAAASAGGYDKGGDCHVLDLCRAADKRNGCAIA
jgi:hypothetical protein